MNKARIEGIALSKLQSCLLKSDYVECVFSTNDKFPSWDGFICLYNKKDSSKKSDLHRRIPVQIKGHFSEPPYQSLISFSVEISDLRNYFNECGVIFFVIYLDNNDNHQIYYNLLTKLKIRRIIKGKENQKNVSISLEQFPMDNPAEFTDIFFNFAKDMSLSPPKNDVSLDDIMRKPIEGYDSLNFSYSGIMYKNDPLGYFLTHPTTLSLGNSALGIENPIDTVYIKKIIHSCNESIFVKDTVYYSSYKIERKGIDQFYLILGKSFIFDLQTGACPSAKLHYGIKGNLQERIHDTKFFLDYLSTQEMMIGNESLKLLVNKDELKSIDIEYFKNSLELFESIASLLKKLNVCEPLDCDKISENDEETLIKLIYTVLNGRTIRPDYEHKQYKLQIANIKILLSANKKDDGYYSITNFFSAENENVYVYQSAEMIIQVPLTFILSEDDFISLDNIDYGMVYSDIVKSQTSQKLKKYTYSFVTDMVSGFFKRKKNKEEFKVCVEKSLLFLIQNVPEYDYVSLKQQFYGDDFSLRKDGIAVVEGR